MNETELGEQECPIASGEREEQTRTSRGRERGTDQGIERWRERGTHQDIERQRERGTDQDIERLLQQQREPVSPVQCGPVGQRASGSQAEAGGMGSAAGPV
ncbi:hypothetical protein AAFF_G00121780 [Aldrovandia affinis]|uniref:Uncharacterized protein n=1 Tax=Aldrovandia affinis TaxID=143900 RepID=A0AAD7RSH6_9TELE|nr:hypothetical protein AAFF_G00121780 [Aldrovandia affinis]